MSVFISWSGENAAIVGEAFRQLLRHSLQRLDIFISSESIRAGKLWFQKIKDGLESAKYGVVIATPRSLTSPWVMFESGAIWKAKSEVDVAVLRVGLTVEQLRGHPLEHFNSTGTTRHEVRGLIDDIAAACDLRIESDILDAAFSSNWEDFEAAVASLQPEAIQVSTPPLQSDGLKIIAERLNSLEQFALQRLDMDRFMLDALKRVGNSSAHAESTAFGSTVAEALASEPTQRPRPVGRGLSVLLGEPVRTEIIRPPSAPPTKKKRPKGS